MGRLHVVVIEDDPAVREGVAMILEKAGYSVTSFFNVEEYDSSPVAADFYLTDRQLPGVDGVELCRRLKADSSTRHIPVIVMSASPDARYLSERAGADAFLEKPFSRKQILALFERLNVSS